MKFYCDNCNTKYSIADEKVRGKVLKVRCKNCQNIITVREQQAPAAAQQQQQASPTQPVSRRSAPPSKPPPAPSKPRFDPASVQWHYAINGQSAGPFDYASLKERFATGELGDECYVWTDSFDGWKPVREVDAFRQAVDKGQSIKPRRNTLGADQTMKAVEREEVLSLDSTHPEQSEPSADAAPVDRRQSGDEAGAEAKARSCRRAGLSCLRGGWPSTAGGGEEARSPT